MPKIRILHGTYRNQPVDGTVAEMLEPAKPGFYLGNQVLKVTVAGDVFGGSQTSRARILINSVEDYELVDSSEEIGVAYDPRNMDFSDLDWSKEVIEGDVDGETEEEAINRIRERFDILDELTTGVGNGMLQGLVVTGAPGVGKSHGVESKLTEMNIMTLLGGGKSPFEVIKGTITPPLLFTKLFEYSGSNQQLVFDDCDAIFLDGDMLNMMKAALDSGKRRFISYNADSKLLERLGVPNRFEFKGSVIFITNLKPESTRSEKLRAHISALFDRVLSLDLTIDTPRDRFLRVKDVTLNSDMLKAYGFSVSEREEILDYLRQNIGKFKLSVSLRTVLNLADIRRMKPNGWEFIARNTLLTRK